METTVQQIIRQDEERRRLPRPLSIKELKERYKNGLESLTTGFNNLDRTGAIYRQQCAVLVAETGMGKSVFAMNLAMRMSKAGLNTLYVDLENGGNQLKDRLEKISEEPENFNILPSELTEELVANNTGIELAEAFISYLNRLMERQPLDFIIIDPLEVFESQKREDYTTLSQVVDRFKKFAITKDLSVLILHHLNKGGKTERTTSDPFNEEETREHYRIPTLESVRGSSKITSRATEVFGLVRQMNANDEFEQSKTLVRVLKSRSGRSRGDYKFYLDTNRLRLSEFVAVSFEEAERIFQ